MRIIGGTHKKRKITPPSNINTRPTTDFAKEALFNILNNNFDFEAISVLDLFAGTGSISFEFASRGAIEVYPVDINHKNMHFIKQQTKISPFPSIKPVRDDAHHFLSVCKKKFDIIFADPPYDHKKIDDIHEQVFKMNLLNSNGWLIIEHGSNTSLERLCGFFEKRKFGKVHFSMFSKE